MSQSQHSNTARPGRPLTIEQLAEIVGVYPLEAYDFVQKGLHFTVGHTHGPRGKGPQGNRHVSGQQLAEGLRTFALMNWGLMARAILARWNITSTYDFGRLVFAMVEAGILHKTEEDQIEDFRNVYDFAEFDSAYRLESKL